MIMIDDDDSDYDEDEDDRADYCDADVVFYFYFFRDPCPIPHGFIMQTMSSQAPYMPLWQHPVSNSDVPPSRPFSL